MRLLYLAGWGYVGIALAMLVRPHPLLEDHAHPAGAVIASNGGWYEQVRPHCNPVEVEVTLAANPAPAGWEGEAYTAACYALAGKIERARQRIDALKDDQRYQAAGIVFDAGHAVADAGDDEAAGPIMELVLRYWPAHYMALYHAGIAQYRTGKLDEARRNLEEFLRQYDQADGWTSSAKETLREIAKGNAR